MGNCCYCGKPAGFLRGKHQACEEAYIKQETQKSASRKVASHQISKNAMNALTGVAPVATLLEAINTIKQGADLEIAEERRLLVSAWEQAVDRALEDGIIDLEEEGRLIEYLNALQIDRSEVDHNGAFSRVVKAAVLRDLLGGNIPERFGFTDKVPVNLQKGEKIVWGFANTEYYEDRIRRQRVGGSQGISLRVMKGVYYRVGAFKSESVETTERKHIDTGWLILTDKNLYFASGTKSMRIPYAKVVAFDPFSDGIGVMRDAQTAKPQLFITGDGWFAYNLVNNLAQY